MGIHHVALATRDAKATHEFYTGPMGFRLVKTAVGAAGEAGFAKHLFYDTGGNGLMAFWDIHDSDLAADWKPAISTALGLPIWANHIAFDATDLGDIEARKTRWLEHGVDVMEIDHGWCTSIYSQDPNGILVEFCTTTAEFTEADEAEALRILDDPAPEPEPTPQTRFFRAADHPR